MECVSPVKQAETRKRFQGMEEPQLMIRQALPEDVMDVLRWRNDAHVRAMSRRTEPIEESAHRIWYSQALGNPDRLLIVGSCEGQKIGIVRFDRLHDSLWEVNIALASEVRGRGLGRQLLKMALSRLYMTHTSAEVLAVTRLCNEPSERLFLSLGFIREKADGMFAHLVLPSDRCQ